MASADYITCDRCNAKVVYDADDRVLDALHHLGFEHLPFLCWSCRQPSEKRLADARAYYARGGMIIDREPQ